jgi:hypothetical protein
MAEGYHVRVYSDLQGNVEVRVERRNSDQSVDTILNIRRLDDSEAQRIKNELMELLSEVLEVDPEKFL